MYHIFSNFYQVHGNMIENSESCIYIKFDNVFKEKLDAVFPRFVSSLKIFLFHCQIKDELKFSFRPAFAQHKGMLRSRGNFSSSGIQTPDLWIRSPAIYPWTAGSFT